MPWIPPTAITKEITKDIFLIKEYIQKSTQGGESKDSFVFYLTNNALKDINFVADFTGSTNIALAITMPK